MSLALCHFIKISCAFSDFLFMCVVLTTSSILWTTSVLISNEKWICQYHHPTPSSIHINLKFHSSLWVFIELWNSKFFVRDYKLIFRPRLQFDNTSLSQSDNFECCMILCTFHLFSITM